MTVDPATGKITWTPSVAGNYPWSHKLETKSLKNGKHTLEFRDHDGTDYSDAVKRAATVDNQKAAGKGVIPMMDTWMMLTCLLWWALFLF